jgi:hypothetical protein
MVPGIWGIWTRRTVDVALEEVEIALVGLTTETDEMARRARLAGSGSRPLRAAAHPRSR